jgi:hypothetical protein
MKQPCPCPLAVFMMLSRTGPCIVCSNNVGQSEKEIKFSGNSMKGKPDPDIGESDMQLYLLEPNIESIAV